MTQLCVALLTFHGTIGEDPSAGIQFVVIVTGMYLPFHKAVKKLVARLCGRETNDEVRYLCSVKS